MDKHPAEALAQQFNNVEHSKKEGHVYQVWQDGEITLQKSGDLLWQRNLHMIVPGVSAPPVLKFPHEDRRGNSFAWVGSMQEAQSVRALIGEDAYSRLT